MSTFAKTISIVAVFTSFAAAADCAAGGSCAKTDETSFVQMQSIMKYGSAWPPGGRCDPYVYGVYRWVGAATSSCSDPSKIPLDNVKSQPSLAKIYAEPKLDMADCCYEWCVFTEKREREGTPGLPKEKGGSGKPAKDKSCKKSLQNCPDECMTKMKAPKDYLHCVKLVTESVAAKKTPAESKEKGITCCNAMGTKAPFIGQNKICKDMVNAQFEAKWDDKLCCVHG